MAAPIKNPSFEAELFRRRALLALLMVAVAMTLLAVGYFRLQVLQFDQYRRQADSNRVKLRPTIPARGLIYDRDGVLLADNLSAYRLELIPEQVEDGETGFVVPVGDVDAMVAAVRRLAEDPGLRARMGEQAQQVGLEKFDAAAAVTAWEDVFDQILDGTLPARP